jgi:SAM-dependent methyltransferase
MATTGPAQDAQTILWNGTAGHAWVEQQALLDATYQGLEDLLVQEASAYRGGQVLDVGCGTGGTTLAIARALGPDGRCVGIDVSEPMVAAARERVSAEGSQARFIEADAQAFDFGDMGFDLVVSRFGVMFFDDPIQAFANIERAMRRGGDMRLLVWREPDDNPFMVTAERAALPVFGDALQRPAGGPGQFAFADRYQVQRILTAAGWDDVSLRPIDVPCRFPGAKLIDWITRLGPVGRLCLALDEDARKGVFDVVLPAFERFIENDEVRFDAACWLVSARGSG